MQDELSSVDVSAIKLAETFFDSYIRDGEYFLGWVVNKPAILYVLSSSVYPTLVKHMQLIPLEEPTPEELQEVDSLLTRYYQGDISTVRHKFRCVLAVLTHIGEIRISKGK